MKRIITDYSKEELVYHYMPRANELARRYFGLGLEDEDVIASAYEGLVLGVDKYIHSKAKNRPLVIDRNIMRTIEKNILVFYGFDVGPYNKENFECGFSKIIELLKLRRDLKIDEKELNSLYRKEGTDQETIGKLSSKGQIEREEIRSHQNALLDVEADYIAKEQLEELLNYLKFAFPNEYKIWLLRTAEQLSLLEIAAITKTSKQYIFEILGKENVFLKRLANAMENDNYDEVEDILSKKIKPLDLLNIHISTNNEFALRCLCRRYSKIAERIANEMFASVLSREERKTISFETTLLVIKDYLELYKKNPNKTQKLYRYLENYIKDPLKKACIDRCRIKKFGLKPINSDITK